MNYLSRYYQFHKILAKRIIAHALSRVRNIKIYCLFFNLRALLYRVDTKVIWIRDIGVFKVSQANLSNYFFNRRYGSFEYADGLENRCRRIGETYFLDHIEFNEKDLVVDCGANVGDLYLYFKINNINISYIAYEPSVNEYKCLALNTLDRENAESFNMALWYETKSIEFFVSSDGADSSIIEPYLFDERVKVSAFRLDELLHKRKKIKLFKLEAEGAEIEVLQGSLSILKNIEFISADLGFERGVQQDSTLVPVTSFHYENGFEMITMSHDRIVALFKNKNFE